eukprot:CAMPEP_0183453176 /NCGR_PEP_ID=MMETSP0370-20130417/120213_1 /TAXON_ID=268820 /ORGANISM="Peridinium aciculiferum, Strain PAER-2" /LENGTH=85 /DNA_ID=CAMNT_0025644547 /DNA_START=14 /DNA_END=271 /DNA_ORIENTATION=+
MNAHDAILKGFCTGRTPPALATSSRKYARCSADSSNCGQCTAGASLSPSRAWTPLGVPKAACLYQYEAICRAKAVSSAVALAPKS